MAAFVLLLNPDAEVLAGTLGGFLKVAADHPRAGVIGPDGKVDVRLTYDHRVLDGATVARALGELERVLACEILAELRYLQAADAA